MNKKIITINHGAGGVLTNCLIKDIVLKYFKNPVIKRLEDAAELQLRGRKIAFTTDSYVIQPIFFPGGDIGKLAVCGTVNDLAMKGAIPKFLSFSLIIEEGLKITDLEKILESAARTAQQAAVNIVCGDTKVVEKGQADKIFITTSGVGIIKLNLSRGKIKTGDLILISGTIGDHGVAIMNQRLELGLYSKLKSDCAPLNLITNKLITGKDKIHWMRDPTRGGVVSVLNELIDGADFGIIIEEKKLPIKKEVRGAAEILGIDPLYIANEGKFIAVVSKRHADEILKKVKATALGKDAAIIGEVIKEPQGVWLKTRIGGVHPLLPMEAEGLPRIC